MFSVLSSSAVQFSIIWWITVETGSAISITIASIVGLLPQAVIGLFAGIWIDRYNRKVVMIIADMVVALSSLILGVAFFFGTPSITFIYIILFLRALGDTFHKPALQAAIPQLVPKEELTKAGGLGQMVNSVCMMAGPMLGALLMSITTLQIVMLVDIIGAALAISMLMTIKIPDIVKDNSKKLTVFQDMKQGFSAIKNNDIIIKISIPVLLATIIFVPLGTLFPLLVKEHFAGTAWHNGVIQTLFSVGMLVGSLIVGITGGFKKRFFTISFGVFLLGICGIIIGVLPSYMFWAFCVVVLIMGMTGMLSNIPYISYIQSSIKEEHLGKVLSLVTSVMSFAAPIGMFIAGPIAESIGVNRWMFYTGIAMIFVGTICYVLTRKYDNQEILNEEAN